MIRLPPRSTRTDTSFPTRRSSDLKFIEPTTDGRLRRSQRPPCRTERTVSRHGEHEFQVIPIHPEPQSHKRPHTISYSRSAETMCISDRKSTRLNSSH